MSQRKDRVYRSCPACLPHAKGDFDYTGRTDESGDKIYACVNCDHERTVKSRSKLAGPCKAQTAAAERFAARRGETATFRQMLDGTDLAFFVIEDADAFIPTSAMILVGRRGSIRPL